MMNLNEVVHNFMQQPNRLGERMRMAVTYRDAAAIGEISPEEMQELLEDLRRLDNIQLAADELDQQIAFDQCIQLLKSVPLP